MSEHIPSEELTLDQVPSPDAPLGELWDFAHTFHGYTHWGGLQEAFEATDRAGKWQQEWLEKNGEPEHGFYPYPEPVLDYLRTDLFLECRAARHCESEPHLVEGVRAVRFWLGER